MALAVASTGLAAQQTPQNGPGNVGVTTTRVLDNAAVTVTRFRFGPGSHQNPHTHPFTVIEVQLTRGQVEAANGDHRRSGLVDPGDVQIARPGVVHWASNPSQADWDLLVISPKKETPGDIPTAMVSYAPSTPATPQMDTVDRVLFPLSAARLALQIDDKRTTESYEAGSVIFVPRGARYALTNVGTTPVTVMSVGVP